MNQRIQVNAKDICSAEKTKTSIAGQGSDHILLGVPDGTSSEHFSPAPVAEFLQELNFPQNGLYPF